MGWIMLEHRKPDKSGIYPAYSSSKERSVPSDWQDALCYFNAEAKQGESKWQHSSGFYDNGITHWMELSFPPPLTEE